MIWFVNQGNVNPIAETYDSSGKAIPSVTNVTLGGHTWNVYHRAGSTISFLRTSNTTSGTVDILALIKWAKDTQGWIGDGNVTDVEFGFEVFDTSGATSTFKCTNFVVNFTASNWSGGGSIGTDTDTITCSGASNTAAPTSVPTATPTTVPTAAPTTATCSCTLGDPNCSGGIDIVDALLVAQSYVGLNPSNFTRCAADVTKDGNIDIVDALRIAQCYVGLASCSF
jgi:hypothetical protein